MSELVAAYARARRRHRADARALRALERPVIPALDPDALALAGTSHYGLVSGTTRTVYPTAAPLIEAVAAAPSPADVAILITDGECTNMLSATRFFARGELDRDALRAALPPLEPPFHPHGRPALAIVDERVVELAAAPVPASRHAPDRAPGLFRHLGLPLVDLEPLIELLPAEDGWIRTAVRNGEGFDSTRWPLALDAAIARFAAHLLDDETDAIEERIRACATLDELRHYQRVTFARQFLDEGATPEMLAPFDLPADVIAEAGERANEGLESELVTIELLAADGAYAYHAARGLWPTAEPAARLVARAMVEYGPWIVAYAIELVEA